MQLKFVGKYFLETSTSFIENTLNYTYAPRSSMCDAVLVMLVSLASLATISCDRMMGVVRPFHTHLKTWQSLAIIVVIWVFSALLAVPWGLYRVYTVGPWIECSSGTWRVTELA